MYQIQNFNFARMSNPEFVAFFVNLQKVIGEISVQSLGISAEQKTLFDSQLKILVDRVYYTRASEFTQRMNEADERRITIYRRTLTKLSCVQYSEDDRELNQLKDVVVNNFLSKYKLVVANIAQQERTAIISGFIYDLKELLDEDAQETLGIYSDITALEGANNAFIASYNSRNTERVEVEKGLTANCRKQLSEIFVLTSFQIQYTANLPAEGDDANKVKDCIDYVNRANGLLDDARTRLNQRLKKEGLPSGEGGENAAGGGGATQGSSQGSNGSNGSTNTDNTGNGGSTNTGNGGQTVDPGSGAIIDGDMAIL